MDSLISNQVQAILRNTPLLKTLGEVDFEPIARSVTEVRIRRGDHLFHQGEPAEHMYAVVDGWVKVFRLTPSGDEVVLAVFTRGQMFAEAAVFMGANYPAGAEAATDARLARIPARPLLDLVAERPEMAMAMLASMSQKLHMLISEVETLKANTGAQRVAAFLLSLCGGDRGAQTVGLPYEKILIAGKIGMKPESLSRAFARLKSVGVDVVGDAAAIEDVGALRAFTSNRGG